MSRFKIAVAVVACCAVLAFFFIGPAARHSARAAGSLTLDDGDPKGAPGFQLAFQSLVKGAEPKTDLRPARLVALYVPESEAPTPFLPPGPFRAIWTADLPLDFKGDFTFNALGRGHVSVLINGEAVYEAEGDFAAVAPKTATLKKSNKLEVRYDSPPKGDACIRLYWGCEDFRPEPLTLSAAIYDDAAPDLRKAQRLREGRELLATHRCLRCHAPDHPEVLTGAGMPELAADAPSLADVGARLKPDWLAKWIADPTSLRPTATMPQVLFGDKGKAAARDIAAYLATLGKPPADDAPPKETAVAAGARLFTNLGCIGCHLPPGRDNLTDSDHQRLPLHNVAAKWREPALRAFLLQPDKHYAWIRMPNFHFTQSEAESLTAFLVKNSKADLTDKDNSAGDVDRGRLLVRESGCLNCHELPGEKNAPRLTAAAFAKLTPGSKGCLDPKVEPGRAAPDHHLTDDQRAALNLIISAGQTSLLRDAPIEFATRQLTTLRCNACHKRDGQDDHWSQLKDESEALVAGLPPEEPVKGGQEYPAEQMRPTLSWIGEKLKPEWTAAFIAGDIPYKPRPFLKARMPSFARQAVGITRGLTFEHGYPPKTAPEPAAAVKMSEIGRNLAGKMRWGCSGCHNMGATAAVGVFEAPGVNFMHIKSRIRRDYFERWLWAPTRVEPGTKMPSVFQYGKPSGIAEVLEGDASKQIDALWQFILLGEKITPPDT